MIAALPQPTTLWDLISLAVIPVGVALAQVWLRIEGRRARRQRHVEMVGARVRAYRQGQGQGVQS